MSTKLYTISEKGELIPAVPKPRKKRAPAAEGAKDPAKKKKAKKSSTEADIKKLLHKTEVKQKKLSELAGKLKAALKE